MQKFFKHHLPSAESVKQNRWLRPFGTLLHHPNLWHLHRRAVAGGVAIGLFCGLIPGPLQMLGAALLAVVFRANLPVALLATLYTNPFTIVPLYLLAYQLGAWVTGWQNPATVHIHIPEFTWSDWPRELMHWLLSLGHPFAIGLPLLAFSLAVSGYIAVRVLWRIAVVMRWRARMRRRSA